MKLSCLTLLASLLMVAASPARLLPSKTIATVSLPSVVQLRAAGERTPLALFWTDPSMARFAAKFKRGLQRDVLSFIDDDLKKAVGLDLGGLSGLAHGQVTVAITGNLGAPGEFRPTLLLLMDTGGRGPALVDLLAKLRAHLTKMGYVNQTRTVRKVEFTAFEIKLGGYKTTVHIGQIGGLLIVGNHPADLEHVLDTLAGQRPPSLLAQPRFAARERAQFHDAVAWAWLDFTIIHHLIQQNLKPGPDDVPDPLGLDTGRLLQAMGLSGLKGVSLSLQVKGEGLLVVIYLEQPARDRRGLFKMLASPPADASPPPFIANNVLGYTRWRRDMPALWAQLESTLLNLSPAVKGGLDFFEGAVKAREPNFDFRRQVIGTLGGDYLSLQLPAPAGKPDEPASGLYLVESTRPALTLAALRAIMGALAQMPAQKRMVEGRTIYSYKVGDSFVEAEKVDVHLAALGGYVAWTNRRETLEAFLRGPDLNGGLKQLRRDPALRAAAAKVGGMNCGWFGYDNTRENLRQFFRVARAEPEAAAFSPLEELFPEGAFAMPDWLDYALLPPFKKVERYFGITVFGVTAGDQGLRLRVFQPVPAPR